MMERLSSTTLAMKVAITVVLVLNAGPCSSQYCGERSDGGWTLCDAGTCCGRDNYCSHLGCSSEDCQYYCSKDQTDQSVGVAVQVDASSSSSSSSEEEEAGLSCAPSLSRLSPAARRRYPWAALGGGNIPTAICGQCLKVTAVGAGGVDAQVKVRVVHTPAIEGLELDRDTFGELDTNGSGSTYNRLAVKYQFESC